MECLVGYDASAPFVTDCRPLRGVGVPLRGPSIPKGPSTNDGVGMCLCGYADPLAMRCGWFGCGFCGCGWPDAERFGPASAAVALLLRLLSRALHVDAAAESAPSAWRPRGEAMSPSTEPLSRMSTFSEP